ncbi:MAG: ABC transporter permease, partial [Oscillospiraceae bacterium]|nr:ABC transporter permease [Oscillospiraceae bacterium]
YISDENFAELEEKFFEGGLELVSMRLENEGDSMFFQAEYKKAISTEGLVYDFTYEMAKTARTMIPGIIAIIITAFALILLVVSLIVIRFRIINSIEESMINIGVQKAIGYKNLQIVLSIAAQFALIALCGGIMGIVTAQLAIPAIIKVLEPLIALVWSFEFDLGAALITMIFVLSAVSLISYVSARKINKLHPLVALRGGITTHSFKKNVFALDKAKGPLGFLLAAKQIAQQKKQSIAIAVIVAAVTMASVTGIAVNYNMTERRDDFARSLFGEMPDVSFMLNENSSGDAFKQRILEYSEVRKAFGYHTGETNLLVDETSIAATIVEDCDLLEGGMLISGRYPKHQNEIALGPAISKVSGKTIGDKAMVKCGEIEKKYLITGIVQFMNQVGFNGIITGEGLCEIQPDFKFTGYNVYLNDGVDTKAFIEKAKSKEGDIFDNIMDVYDNLKTTMDTMSDIFAAVAIGILGVTVFVVVLVLYMVIKTSIIHQKREFGIQKALGFVTFQLMNQIALNMSPIIFFGVLLGTLAGYFGLNPIFVALMSGMGVIRVQFEMPVLPIVAVCVALVMTAYAVSMLIAWRIRKISAYAFISE